MEAKMVSKKIHVAVVDDDQDITDLLANYFKSKNQNVTTFNDAESALEKILTDRSFDIVITDLELPKISGLELTQKIKNAGIDIPIIVLTVNQDVEVAMKAVYAGAYDFIVKPIPFPQLQVSIERAMYLRRLKDDNQSLRSILKNHEVSTNSGVIGRSQIFLKTVDLATRVAKSMATVLVSGESGTGKEVIAKLIHNSSNRSQGPFIAINCSAIPENLLESELFGHAKGSFTGAQEKKLGLFEEAAGGTIFLDEIGDMGLALQSKLLRVLQERKIKRVGENQTRDIDVRVISATHKNLAQEVNDGRFREDLFFRLNVVPIRIPALRERKEDIISLAEYFLQKHGLINGALAKSFSKDALQYLLEKQWKGNVRELENAIERSVVLSTGNVIQKSELVLDDTLATLSESDMNSLIEHDFPVKSDGKLFTLHELTQKYIQFALEKNSGAKDKTAKDLEIDRKTLYRRVRMQESVM